MRLLSFQEVGRVSLTDDIHDELPPYAILSHTWGSDDEEVTFEDIRLSTGSEKSGYRKIDLCGTWAAAHGLNHFWVDTCCINKANAVELQEAITSMFQWYRKSTRCYVYLPDVHMDDSDPTAWHSAFRQSKWFTRGWTLQELLAPSSVEFFDGGGRRIGDKKSLIGLLNEITGISIDALQGRPISAFSVDERMLWARGRNTKRKEDKAYSLFGIFGVSMRLEYGEGEEHAMNRLRKKIKRLEPTSDQESHCIIPLGRNKGFIGRATILDDLVKMILPDTDPHDCQRVAIEGLGGVGKTQIALEAIFRIREQDPSCSVFWVPAVSRATFENGYREIGQALKIPRIGEHNADIKSLVTAALSKTSRKWLLIIDNADDTELLFGGVNGFGICDCLPFSTKGSILFTTRNHEVVARLDIHLDQTFTIDAMSEGEALQMLGRAIKPEKMRDSSSTKALLELLTYLPLAIKQAAAYMARTGLSVKDYLEGYRRSDKSRIDSLSRHFEDRSRYQDIANPIATTWLISFNHIEKHCPLAARYLKFISFLAEKDVPRALLLEYEEEGSAEALGVLQGYSFVTEREDGDSFDVHRLVKLAAHESVGSETSQYATEVIRHLERLYPFPEHENKHVWMRYIPHVEAILKSSRTDTDKEAKAKLLKKAGISYYLIGRYRATEHMHRQALHLLGERLGLEHTDTLVIMDNLGIVLNKLGKYKEAEQMHQQAFQLLKKNLGPKHPNTIASMDNLGIVLNKLRKYKEAEQMHRQAFELTKENLGPEHLTTLNNMENLGAVLYSQGKYEEVEQMFQRAFELKKKKLGPTNPDTVLSMDNLGAVFHKLGKYEEAKQMHQQALELKKEEFGQKHISMVNNMNNLGLLLNASGKYKEAEQMHRQALEIKKEYLGLIHPDTLASMDNLGSVLINLGRYEEAERLYRQASRAWEEQFGKTYPDTIISMNGLATALRNLGKHEDVE
ncbi:TPR-like protein [Hypoxylon argillaceum]|nr:TPR-like protein [Hypoxylon argillaceum]